MKVGLVCCIAALVVIALFPFETWVVAAAIAALGVFYNGLALTTVNGLGVFLSPEEAPAALPGLNGAAFGIGASLGIAIVAPFVLGGSQTGIRIALWISVGITVLAFIASRFVPSLPTLAAVRTRRMNAH
jgi:fucose permease